MVYSAIKEELMICCDHKSGLDAVVRAVFNVRMPDVKGKRRLRLIACPKSGTSFSVAYSQGGGLLQGLRFRFWRFTQCWINRHFTARILVAAISSRRPLPLLRR